MMKKRLLCLILSLLLAVSLCALPAQAADSYRAYTEPIRAAMKENGDAAPGYGLLYDLDGNGTDELLMVYRASDNAPFVVLSVYTLRGGAAETLLDHRALFAEVGGESGTVSVVRKDGRTLLLAERTSPEALDAARVRVTGDAELYTLDGTMKRLSRLEYTRIDRLDGAQISDEGFSCSEQTPDATEPRTLAQYKAWFDALERTAVLTAYDYHNTSDGLPLELLLGRLEGHIGPFTDVPADAWFSDSVEWALLHKITKGTSDTAFLPDATCTRAQMVTFLWRAHGSPKVLDAGALPFTDVPDGEYYADAVRWAVALGITTGVTETSFAPDATVTRAQTVTFLWRDACHPSAAVPQFSDVPQDAYFAPAVGWAQETGVTTGVTATTFAPDSPCTRAQIVTFLSRAACRPGLHVADVTGLECPYAVDYATDEIGKLILFTAVGDVEDLAIASVVLTADGQLLPDATVHEAGPLHDGEHFLLRTGIPDVAARYAVRFTIGERTVTLAIQDSGRDGSLYLTEIS